MTPEQPYRIDPLSETLGELRADVRWLRTMVTGLYGLVTLGFTLLSWLVTRGHP